ncbi:hypothetical protein CXF85_02860 [Colwellia sp. 75C3]|nr:hypothetical protein CXF85_02860 [Colwellia sp. 75C3]
MLEFDENVISYSTQPETFDVYGIEYSPDILVHTKRDGDYYEEVKGDYYLKKDGFEERFELQQKCVKALSRLPLRLVTESKIKKAPLRTLNRLNKYQRQDINKDIDIKKLPTKPILFSQLQDIIFSKFNADIGDVWTLFSHSIFTFDFKAELTPDTLVWRAR